MKGISLHQAEAFYARLSSIPSYAKYDRRDIDKLLPQKRAELEYLRNSLNAALRIAQDAFLTDNGSKPSLYFDYLPKEGINALAFSDSDNQFIGLTYSVATEVHSILQALSSRLNECPLIQLREPRFDLLALLFRAVLTIIVFHELGHHVYGHVGGDGVYAEDDLDSDERDFVAFQAREVDADQYAMSILCSCFGLSPTGAEWHDLKDADLSAGHRAAIVLTASGMMAHVLQGTIMSTKEILRRKHPPAITRLDFMLGTFKANCSVDQSSISVTAMHLLEWLEKGYPKSAGAIVQANALSQAEWERYMACLQRTRQEQRNLLKSRCWRVI